MPPKFVKTKPILKQGSLLKKGWWITSYKDRWFILQERNLFYFVGEQQPPLSCDDSPKGTIELLGATIQQSPNDKAVLLIKTPERTWELRAPNIDQAEKWFEKMTLAQRGEYLYDDETAIVDDSTPKAIEIQIQSQAQQQQQQQQQQRVDARTGVDFRILPADVVPLSTTTAINNVLTVPPPTVAARSSGTLSSTSTTAAHSPAVYDDSEFDAPRKLHSNYADLLDEDIYEDGIEVPSVLLPTSVAAPSTVVDDDIATTTTTAAPVPRYIGTSGGMIDIGYDPNDVLSSVAAFAPPADEQQQAERGVVAPAQLLNQALPESMLFPAAPADDFIVPQPQENLLYPAIPNANPLAQPQRYYA